MSVPPAVSVLMAVYDGAAVVDETLASLADQTLVDWEAVVVDDGSRDGTLRVLEEWSRREPRIVVTHQENAGLTRSLNRGLARARGTYVARIDAGDVARPDRLATQREFLEANAEHVAVGSHLLWTTPEGWPVGVHRCPLVHAAIDAAHIAGTPGQIPHAGLMVRRAALTAVGGYCEDFAVAQDYDLLLRLAERGRLANLDAVLTRCRLDPDGVSSKRREEQVRAAREAVARARVRRGLPPLAAEPRLWRGGGRTELLERWVREAIVSGFSSTARRYAWRLWRERPGWMSTRLLLRAAYDEARGAVVGRQPDGATGW